MGTFGFGAINKVKNKQTITKILSRLLKKNSAWRQEKYLLKYYYKVDLNVLLKHIETMAEIFLTISLFEGEFFNECLSSTKLVLPK